MKKGLTLLELILYVALAGFGLISIVGFGWRTLETQGKVNRAAELLQNGRLALHRINQFVREADRIVPEAAGGSFYALSSATDTWIQQNAPIKNYGTSREIHAYPWAPGSSQRGLMRFDLSLLPQGAAVEQATLWLKELSTSKFNRAIALHRVRRAWTERGATWNSAGAAAWTAPGGDYEAVPTSVIDVIYDAAKFPKKDSWDVTTDVQAFLRGEASNYGWLIKDQAEDNSQRYWMFHSRENTSPPQLTVKLSAQGSLFSVNPGALALDFPGAAEDVMIDTVIAPNQHRKLRLSKGGNPALDLTGDDVNVTEFIVEDVAPSGGNPMVQINLTLTQGDETLRLQTSAAVRIH